MVDRCAEIFTSNVPSDGRVWRKSAGKRGLECGTLFISAHLSTEIAPSKCHTAVVRLVHKICGTFEYKDYGSKTGAEART